jgi:hypothetical protein
MKLISAILGTALAGSWPGQSDVDPCGTQVKYAGSAINQTCTIDMNGKKPWRVFVGGAYILPDTPWTFTNYEGLAGEETDVVVFWTEDYFPGSDPLELDNSTCGADSDVIVDCVDYGGAWDGLYFQETANDFRMSKGSNYNIQIIGAVAGDTLTIQLNDAYGNPYSCQNISSNSGEIIADGTNVILDTWGNLYSDTGKMVLQVGDQVAMLVHIDTTQQPGMNWEPSLWHSTVTK